MPIVLFEPEADPHGHAAVVFRQFADGINVPPDRGARLLRRMFAAGARCAVWYSAQDPWAVVGFAIVTAEPQTVIWCWTRPINRTTKAQRQDRQRNGVMTDLLARLGVDINAPTIALFRSLAAEGMRRHGKPITFTDELPQGETDP